MRTKTYTNLFDHSIALHTENCKNVQKIITYLDFILTASISRVCNDLRTLSKNSTQANLNLWIVIHIFQYKYLCTTNFVTNLLDCVSHRLLSKYSSSLQSTEFVSVFVTLELVWNSRMFTSNFLIHKHLKSSSPHCERLETMNLSSFNWFNKVIL